jgi:hypothetical protein
MITMPPSDVMKSPLLDPKRIEEMEADARERNRVWREHLANWAHKELRRRGLMMHPDGVIRPIPTRQEVPLSAASKNPPPPPKSRVTRA